MAFSSWLRRDLPLRSKRTRTTKNSKRTYELQLEKLEDRTVFAVRTWTGFAPTGAQWSNPLNWDSGTPQAGDDLIFRSGTNQVDRSINDLPIATHIRSITILGNGGVTMGGNLILLSHGIFANNINQLAGQQAINLSIGLTSNATIKTTFEQGILNINGFVSMSDKTLTLDGAGITTFATGSFDGFAQAHIIKEGIGRVNFQGSNNILYSGNITINNGEFFVNNANALGNINGLVAVTQTGQVGDIDYKAGSLVLGGGIFAKNIQAIGDGFGGSGAINAVGSSTIGAATFGSLIAKGHLTLGAGEGIVLTFGTNGAFGNVNQDVSNVNLTKVGTGLVLFSNQVQLTGQLTINGGGVLLNNNGVLSNSTITLNNGSTLDVDYGTGTVALSTRLPDQAPINLNSGVLVFRSRPSAEIVEQVGNIHLASGHNVITLQNNHTTATARFLLDSQSLTRDAGATLVLNQAQNSTGVFNTTQLGHYTDPTVPANVTGGQRITFQTAPTNFIHEDVIPFIFYNFNTTNLTTGLAFATYDANPHPNDPLGRAVGFTTSAAMLAPSATIMGASATQAARLAAGTHTVTANHEISALQTTGAVTLNVNAGFTLTIGSGGILATGGALTINLLGSGAGAAVLQLDGPIDGEAFILTANQAATIAGTIFMPSVSAANGLSISSWGGNTTAGGTVSFTGSEANSYLGPTRLHAGTLTLAKVAGVVAVPGDLIVGDRSGAVTYMGGSFQTGILDQVNVSTAGQLQAVSAATIAPIPLDNAAGANLTPLDAGSYFLKYTFVLKNGGETVATSSIALDQVTEAEQWQLTVPNLAPAALATASELPSGVERVRIYLGTVAGQETWWMDGEVGQRIIDLDQAFNPNTPSPGGNTAPSAISSAFADVTVYGGATLAVNPANQFTAGNTNIRNLTMQASSHRGNLTTVSATINGNALLTVNNSTLTLLGNVSVLAPVTSSLFYAGTSNIQGAGTNALQLGISNPASPQNRTFTVEDGAAINDLSVLMSIVAPGANLGIVKEGPGAMLLGLAGNINTYTGPTQVNDGTLVVNGPNNSSITVGPNGKLYGGMTTNQGTAFNVTSSGVISAGQIVGASGLPGFPVTNPNANVQNARGTLAFGGQLNVAAGSKVLLEIAGYTTPPPIGLGTDFDRINVAGTFTIQPGVTLEIDLNGVNLGGLAQQVITYNGVVGTFTDVTTKNNPFGFVPVLVYNGSTLDIAITPSNPLLAPMPAPTNLLAVGNNSAAGNNNNVNPTSKVRVYNALNQEFLYEIAVRDPKTNALVRRPVEVALGDVNGDGVKDIIVALQGVIVRRPNGSINLAASTPTFIYTFNGLTGKAFTAADGQIPKKFAPFGNYYGRVFVAAGRLDGDNNEDIIAAMGDAPRSVANVNNGANKLTGSGRFNAWSSANFTVANRFFGVAGITPFAGRGGVRIAVGQATGSASSPVEIYTTPGPGTTLANSAAVQVKIWNAAGNLIKTFTPYAPNTKTGAFIGTGDFNNDGISDLVIHSRNQQVRIFDGTTISPTSTVAEAAVLGSAPFTPFPGFAGQVRVDAAIGDAATGATMVVASRFGTPNNSGRLVQYFEMDGTVVQNIDNIFSGVYNQGLNIATGRNSGFTTF